MFDDFDLGFSPEDYYNEIDLIIEIKDTYN